MSGISGTNAGVPVAVGHRNFGMGRNLSAARRRGRGEGVRRLLAVRVTAAEAIAGSVTFAASLTPALYPRPAVVQGILTGIALVIGRLAARLVTIPGPPSEHAAPSQRHRWLRRGAWCVAVLVGMFAVVLNFRWQSDVRALMEMGGHPVPHLLTALLIATITAYGLTLAGRAVTLVPRGYGQLVARAVPGPGRFAVHAVVAVVLSVVVADVVIAGHAVRSINDRLVAADASFAGDVVPPTAPQLSGAPESLVPWTTLGRMGRAFVAATPTTTDLTEFSGEPSVPPIRSYVGLQSAPTVRARVELAMAELDRSGAFDRQVLLVVSPTGTGSVNRHAVAPLEYLYNGNIATVAVQYSYLPSWAVMAGNQERAARTTRALFAAVEQRLRQLQRSERPLLLLYGESLGSFGSEQIFKNLADVRSRVGGVLWVGPPRANGLWRELTENRDPGSPVWRPLYDGGREVRFGADGADLLAPHSTWTAPRVAYLQHGSDPVTWWSPQLLFNRPEWLGAKRPRDISQRTPYVPVVTFVQTTIDTVLGGSAPMHYGHIYGTEQAEAWAAIAPPSGWSPADTRRLVAVLDRRQ